MPDKNNIVSPGNKEHAQVSTSLKKLFGDFKKNSYSSVNATTNIPNNSSCAFFM